MLSMDYGGFLIKQESEITIDDNDFGAFFDSFGLGAGDLESIQTWKCPACDFIACISSSEQLAHIERAHSPDGGSFFACPETSCRHLVFGSSDLWLQHVNGHASSRSGEPALSRIMFEIIHFSLDTSTFQCALCSAVSGTFQLASDHLRRKHKIMFCPACEYTPHNILDRFEHIETSHKSAVGFDCPGFCTLWSTQSFDEWLNHIAEHVYHMSEAPEQEELPLRRPNLKLREKRFNCAICAGYATDDPVKLERHERRCKKRQIDSVCLGCGYVGSDPNDRRRHVRKTHTVQGLFKCTRCSYITGTMQRWCWHLGHVHDVSGQPKED